MNFGGDPEGKLAKALERARKRRNNLVSLSRLSD